MGTALTRTTPSIVPSSNQPAFPERQADSASIAPLRNDTAPDEPSATADGKVDLNTASVEQLNGLGAAMIGKRVIDFRPYTSPDELLVRRVVKRDNYRLIKAAITVLQRIIDKFALPILAPSEGGPNYKAGYNYVI